MIARGEDAVRSTAPAARRPVCVRQRGWVCSRCGSAGFLPSAIEGAPSAAGGLQQRPPTCSWKASRRAWASLSLISSCRIDPRPSAPPPPPLSAAPCDISFVLGRPADGPCVPVSCCIYRVIRARGMARRNGIFLSRARSDHKLERLNTRVFLWWCS